MASLGLSTIQNGSEKNQRLVPSTLFSLVEQRDRGEEHLTQRLVEGLASAGDGGVVLRSPLLLPLRCPPARSERMALLVRGSLGKMGYWCTACSLRPSITPAWVIHSLYRVRAGVPGAGCGGACGGSLWVAVGVAGLHGRGMELFAVILPVIQRPGC